MEEHRRGQEQDAYGGPNPEDLRYRMAVACDVCRSRKVRCDGSRPCFRCSSTSRTCTFSLPRPRQRQQRPPLPLLPPTAAPSRPSRRRAKKEPTAAAAGPSRLPKPSSHPSTPRKRPSTRNGRCPAHHLNSNLDDLLPLSGVNGDPSNAHVVAINDLDASADRRDDPLYESRVRATTTTKSSENEHLLLVDHNDQLVHSGPSSGMPLFAKLGLLRTVEVSENAAAAAAAAQDSGNVNNVPVPNLSRSSNAIGLAQADTDTVNYFDICLDACPRDLMFNLIGHHFHSPVFMPMIHRPSFLAELIAIMDGRRVCTPQAGALLMSVLAVTARLVWVARDLLPEEERSEPGEKYYQVALKLLSQGRNKLDFRHIMALYHLALFAEGHNPSAGIVSAFVSGGIGLAFATGLHRSHDEYKMNPVATQIRIRLFWALYGLDTALACSLGRPNLVSLAECSVGLPAPVDDDMITEDGILPQPEDQPAVIRVCSNKIIEIHVVLEQVLAAINTPVNSVLRDLSIAPPPADRKELLSRARTRLDEIEAGFPLYIVDMNAQDATRSNYIRSARVRSPLYFVRTLIARQELVEELEKNPGQLSKPSLATLAACRLSLILIHMYTRLKHACLLHEFGFTSISHLTAAGHTLVVCMLRNAELALDHRPDLLITIEVLHVFALRYRSADKAAQLLIELSQSLEKVTLSSSVTGNGGSSSSSNYHSTVDAGSVPIRVLVRKPSSSPYTRSDLNLLTPPAPMAPMPQTEQHFDFDWMLRNASSDLPTRGIESEISSSSFPVLPLATRQQQQQQRQQHRIQPPLQTRLNHGLREQPLHIQPPPPPHSQQSDVTQAVPTPWPGYSPEVHDVKPVVSQLGLHDIKPVIPNSVALSAAGPARAPLESSRLQQQRSTAAPTSRPTLGPAHAQADSRSWAIDYGLPSLPRNASVPAQGPVPVQVQVPSSSFEYGGEQRQSRQRPPQPLAPRPSAATALQAWAGSFSFLNDGLFGDLPPQ